MLADRRTATGGPAPGDLSTDQTGRCASAIARCGSPPPARLPATALRSTTSRGTSKLLGDPLHGASVHRRKRGPQHLVPSNDLVQTGPQRRHIQRPVTRTARPGCCRTGCPAPTDPGTTAAPGRTTAADRPFARTGFKGGQRQDALCPWPLDSRWPVRPPSAASNSSRNGSSTWKVSPHARDQLRGQQRMAAQTRRSCRGPRPAPDARRLAQIPASALPPRVRGGTYSFSNSGRTSVRLRQRPAIHFPVRRQGKASR